MKANDEELEQDEDELNKSQTSEELKFNTEITMINRKISTSSSKKSSLRKTSACSHISKIAVQCECDSVDSSNSQNSGFVNTAFDIEPPSMYSNEKKEPIDAISKLNDSINYKYYSKC